MNTSEHTTIVVWLTGQQQAVCTTITHHNKAGGLCPVNNRGHCNQYSHNPLHSQGEREDEEETHNQEGCSQMILRWARNLEREVIPEPTWQDADNCTVNIVIVPGALNYNSTRGTELCKCQGHLTLNSARGTEHLWCHGHIGQLWQTGTVFGFGQVRWIFCIFCCSPCSRSGLGISNYF